MPLLPSLDEFIELAKKVPYQQLPNGLLGNKSVDIWVRRDDLLDPIISGNKFYKLFFNLTAAMAENKVIVSAGGPYSNHIHALAGAGYRYGVKTIGIIRGEHPTVLSPTLQDAEQWGMTLKFVAREKYTPSDEKAMLALANCTTTNAMYVPEGGDNSLGYKGTVLLGQIIGGTSPVDFDCLCVASGTGNTLSGLAAGLAQVKRDHQFCVKGFSVLKGHQSLVPSVGLRHHIQHAENAVNWSIISGFHLGGYGKRLPTKTAEFANDIESKTAIPLDPVYTAKLFWGVQCLVEQGYWKAGTKLLLLHTGGTQGRRGFVK